MITVITGGSGSGKSAYAEGRILSYGEGRRIYIATMEPFGEEGARRIKRHHKLREGKGFETVERYTNLAELEIPKESQVLLECMSNLVANEMFRADGAGENLAEAVLKGVENLRAQAKNVCVVTNDVFSDSGKYEEETREYQKYLGKVNLKLAQMADEVIEVVYGIPVWLKGGTKTHETIME